LEKKKRTVVKRKRKKKWGGGINLQGGLKWKGKKVLSYSKREERACARGKKPIQHF